MNEVFSILIDSRARFETGIDGGEWLPMPATEKQLQEAMERVGITADNPQDFFINGIANTEDYPVDIPLPVIRQSTPDELNYLAKLLEMQGDDDRDKFTAAVTLGEYAGSVKDLINLAQNLDCYWLYPTVHNEQDYGYYLIDELDELELPEAAKKYFRYEEYGRDAIQNDGGRFTDQGYIYNNKNTFTEWYNGKENDIPGKYKIMGYPQAVKPDPEKTEMESAVNGQAKAADPDAPRLVIPLVLTSEKPAEKLKEITEKLEAGVQELFESERYKEYLQVMSKFHSYSFNNTVLIALQKPDASLIAGFNSWKNNFGRNVVKGEKGIKIIAPSPYKVKQQFEKLDPVTQQPLIGNDGKPVTEEREVTIPAYKVVSVFDVSQTEGRDLPNVGIDVLTGDVDRYDDFFAALENASPVPIGFENIAGGAHGYYHLQDKRIAIDEGMSELQTLKTAIHEIAHAKLHDIDLNLPHDKQENRPDKNTREVEAESIAYSVCQYFRLDTSDYSFDYVAEWSSNKELKELKGSLETIRSTADEIINSVNGYFAELQKTQEKEQPAQEPVTEPAAEAAPDPKAEPTVTIIWSEHSRFHDGETMTLSEANALLGSLDAATAKEDGYYKTKFRIDFVMNGQPDNYIGRQDLGDGDGSLIEHIEDYHTYYENNSEWENYLLKNEGREALEADRAQREMILHEFVPFLKLHDNLSKMEQAADAALQNGDSLTPTETAYHTAVKEYVSECREQLNSGNYELPPAPRLADFDTELQEYRETVKEEIAKEAASAGMTVEEYAANGYEPYDTPDQEAAYQLANDNYLYVQTSENGYDYTLYNPDLSELDGGQLDNPGLSMTAARDEILTLHEQPTQGITDLPVSDFEKMRDDAGQQTPPAKQQEASVKYYPINENAARRAKEANSFSDYKPGSATAEYRHYVDEAAKIAARQKKRVDPQYHEKIDGLLDTYARKLAANMNKGYEIAGRVPSILIAGASNFPVRKKEKQNAATDKNMREFGEIQGLLDKIRSTGMGGISADDPNAVEKLENKLAALENAQETMKAVNAYYRKNKTLDGCPDLTPEQTETLKASMESSYRANPKPFESYQLSNNNAEIHRVKDRIASLTRHKEIGYAGWEFDGGKVEANKQDNRLQVFFDEKPDEAARNELKGNGFRWSPSAGAWQRQLNDNAIYAADRIKCIAPITGERPTEIQKRARQGAAADKPGFTPETIYKMRQNPYSDSRENGFLVQAYLTQENGMAKMGDVLFTGTPEQCHDLMKKLETGELTQGQAKELYAKAQEQPETPLPDPTISIKDMQDYGYLDGNMLPLQQEAAERLFTKEDIAVFRIYGDNTEAAVTDLEDLRDHAEKGGIFGVEKDTWIALQEYVSMKQDLQESEPSKEALLLYGKEDTFGIYQLKRGDDMRDYHFEPYDRLQAAGLSVDRANYELIYTAALEPGAGLEDIYTRFNIDHPADFKGHSLSVSDIVVLHQNGQNTAHYVDSIGYQQVPEFFREQQQQLTPDALLTGEQINTPRGSFHVTNMTVEQMREAGYGVHHNSEDGKYIIMGNGTQAFAVPAQQPENYLKNTEEAVEQNANSIDGIINNTPTADELEARAKAGEQISLTELAAALKNDKERGGDKREKKPSIRAQLKADKKQTEQKKPARNKSQDRERS